MSRTVNEISPSTWEAIQRNPVSKKQKTKKQNKEMSHFKESTVLCDVTYELVLCKKEELYILM